MNHGVGGIIYDLMHQRCQHKAPEFGNDTWHGLNILSLTAKQNPKALTESFVIHHNITWINKIKSQTMERVKHFMIKTSMGRCIRETSS